MIDVLTMCKQHLMFQQVKVVDILIICVEYFK